MTNPNRKALATIIRHLRKQGRKAEGPDGKCMYRAPNGDRCAVGCIIPDEQYKPDMEGVGATALLPRVPSLSALDPLMLLRCQVFHDVTTWTRGDVGPRLVHVLREHGGYPSKGGS